MPTNPFAADSQPQASAPSAPATPPPVDDDPFANSDPAPQAARAPRFRELYGRLVIIVPISVEKGLVSQRFKDGNGNPVVQDRMTADLILLDGGEIEYGGRPEEVPPVPHTQTATPPQRWEGVYMSQAGIVSQCREALARRASGKPGMVLGRVAKGGPPNHPWLLTAATEADKAIGRAYLARVDPFAS